MTAKSATTRNRTGCWTCRRRGYRCDEAKPECQTCTRLKISCEGYTIRLRWDGNNRARKARKGSVKAAEEPCQEDDKSKCVTILSPPQWVEDGRPKCTSLSPPPQRLLAPPSQLPSRSPQEVFLLQHFDHTVAGLLSSTSDSTINTYRRVILPMAMSCDLLFDAVLSLSAVHLSSRHPEYAVCASQHKARVLRQLISKMNNIHDTDETTLATVIVLIIHEVFDDNADNWVTHLNGAASIISAFMSKYSTTSIPSSTRMLLDIFAYHDVLASVSQDRAPIIPQIYTKTWSALSGRRTAFLSSVDTIISVVVHLSALAVEARQRNVTILGDLKLSTEAVSHWHTLVTWSPPEGIVDDTRNTAEAMRHAAKLYYLKIVGAEGPSYPRMDECASTILGFLKEVSCASPSVASHPWPLYMAGCFVKDEAEKQCVSERLVEMKKLRGVKTIDGMKDGLTKIWNDPLSPDAKHPVILL